MKLLLETTLSISGLVIFFVIAFLFSSLFWVGLVFLLIFETTAFIVGYLRREQNREKTLEEVVEKLDEDEKEK